MKKFRKISSLLLAGMMLLLTACGGNNTTGEEVQAPVVTTGEAGAMERTVNPAEPCLLYTSKGHLNLRNPVF